MKGPPPNPLSNCLHWSCMLRWKCGKMVKKFKMQLAAAVYISLFTFQDGEVGRVGTGVTA
jgi:hypothetical protein